VRKLQNSFILLQTGSTCRY